jgi:DNA adenine methylase
VRDSPALVAQHLQQHAARHSAEHYYAIRDLYNRSEASAAQAARFIYLNKTCYNGIFRVNQSGCFNVPYGRYPRVSLPDATHLRQVSSILTGKEIFAAPFEVALREAKHGDFIYLDPPYPPLNGTSYFTHYTPDKFSSVDQEQLASVAKDLTQKGCLLMLSNADVPIVRSLYAGFKFFQIPVTRYITCKKERRQVQELVITNYSVK